MMYIFEYFIYHLKPYGISTKVMLPYVTSISEETHPKTNIQHNTDQASLLESGPPSSPQNDPSIQISSEKNDLPNFVDIFSEVNEKIDNNVEKTRKSR